MGNLEVFKLSIGRYTFNDGGGLHNKYDSVGGYGVWCTKFKFLRHGCKPLPASSVMNLQTLPKEAKY